MTVYTKKYYNRQRERSRASAEEVVPLILQMIHLKSVVDVGCGAGTWLSVFKKHGVGDVCGVDGEYVDRGLLQISQEQFFPFDLKKPLKLNRRFDLVVSLEVAEHLPSECAEIFVNSLVSLAPVVLFSAAAPFQGGTSHVNEQWPEYWQKYFEKHGYVVIDALRGKIWKNEKIQYWYRQNILFFADRKYLDNNPVLKSEREKTNINQLSVVHPELYLRRSAPPPLSKLPRLVFGSIKNSLKYRLAKRVKNRYV